MQIQLNFNVLKIDIMSAMEMSKCFESLNLCFCMLFNY